MNNVPLLYTVMRFMAGCRRVRLQRSRTVQNASNCGTDMQIGEGSALPLFENDFLSLGLIYCPLLV